MNIEPLTKLLDYSKIIKFKYKSSIRGWKNMHFQLIGRFYALFYFNLHVNPVNAYV